MKEGETVPSMASEQGDEAAEGGGQEPLRRDPLLNTPVHQICQLLPCLRLVVKKRVGKKEVVKRIFEGAKQKAALFLECAGLNVCVCLCVCACALCRALASPYHRNFTTLI